jgi:hypothetical protein
LNSTLAGTGLRRDQTTGSFALYVICTLPSTIVFARFVISTLSMRPTAVKPLS